MKTDLVDRIVDYLRPRLVEDEIEALKSTLRERFGGQPGVFKPSTVERQHRADEVLRLFNGKNASEVARTIGIGRSTVYRFLKQPGSR